MTPEQKLAEIGIYSSSPPVGGEVRLPSKRITGPMIGYEQIIDALLLSPPGENQGAVARRLGYTQAWLSRLLSSDAFQTRLAKRLEALEPERQEMFKARFASIEEEARGILMASLNKLSARLDDPAGVPDELLIRSATMTSKLLGYGAKQEASVPKVEMHVHLEQLASNLRNLNRSSNVTIDQAPAVAGDVSEPGN